MNFRLRHSLFSLLMFLSLQGWAQHCNCAAGFDSTLFKTQFFTYETAPLFPGGQVKMRAYLDSAVAGYAVGMKGFSMSFVIDTLGKVQNACLVSNTVKNGLTENEQKILEALKRMPAWTPGTIKGEKVPSAFQVPLKEKY